MRSPEQIAADLDLHIEGHESIRRQGYSGPDPYYLPLLREAAEALRAAEKVIEAARADHPGPGCSGYPRSFGARPLLLGIVPPPPDDCPVCASFAAWDARRST